MRKEELQKIIGENLHQIRTAKKMTQEQLAEKAGLSTSFYANVECGNKMVSVVTLRKLADVLGVSTDSLLYPDRSDAVADRIYKTLQNQPESIARLAEKMVQFCVNEISQIGDFAGAQVGQAGEGDMHG